MARLPWRQHLAEVTLLLPRTDTHIQSSSPRSPHWAEEISSLEFLRHCSNASSSLAALGNYNSHSAALGGWPQRRAEPGCAFSPCAGCWPWGDPRSQRIPVPLRALRYVGCSVTGAVCWAPGISQRTQRGKHNVPADSSVFLQKITACLARGLECDLSS